MKYKAVNAGYLLATMTEADTELNIMILDACREHPFAVFDDPSRQRLYVAPMTTQDPEILREYVEMITNGATRLSATFRFRDSRTGYEKNRRVEVWIIK